jgi:surface polysaccharide O-acyltransferase-like enzyme
MKNNTLNFIKTIACAMVVFIHIKFPYEYGYYVNTLARFGVPFFFMISGYFSFKNFDTVDLPAPVLPVRPKRILGL